MTAYLEHHLHFLARNLSSHRDKRNRAVHLVATIVGFCTIVSMLARIHPAGAPAICNAGTLLGIGAILYYVWLDPLATAIVALAWLAMGLTLGPAYGQAGRGAPIGIGVPLAIFLAFNLTGVWTHRLYGDVIVDPHSNEPTWKRLLKTLHTILFSSVQFVLFALLDLGYRPALKAALADATRAYATRRNGVKWQNWSTIAECVPAVSFFPETPEDIVAIVKEAAANGRRVRVVGQGHSWPHLCTTPDYLVFTSRLTKVEIDVRDPARPRAIVEAGATNEILNDALAKHGLTLPFNVVLESVRIGGLIGTGSHGSGHAYPTLSDLVESIEIVDAAGEIRRFSEETDGAEVMNAMRLHLGLFGVVWRVTLRVSHNFRVRRVDRRAPIDSTLRDLKSLLDKHHAVDLFIWPFCDELWIKSQDLTDAPKQEERLRKSRGKRLRHSAEAVLHRGVAWALLRFPRLTPALCRLAFRLVEMGDVVVDVADAVHWRGAIEDVKVTCQEFSFKVDDDLDNVRIACQAVFDRLEAWAARGQYPFNLTLNLRFVASSRALMSPASGPGLNCYIEMLSELGTPGWERFSAEVAREWMKLPRARPHWGKEWEHIPGIAGALREAYGDDMQRFLAVRDKTGVDPHRMFTNRLMDAIFDADIPIERAYAEEREDAGLGLGEAISLGAIATKEG